jgi:hypothetical protein
VYIALADSITEPASHVFQHASLQIYLIIRNIQPARHHIPKFFQPFWAEIFADNRKSVIFAFPINGALAERLGTGLQNLLQRFDSARHLWKSL